MTFAIEFPGTPVIQNGNAAAAGLTVTLPVPAAGLLQYLSKIVVSVASGGAVAVSGTTINNLNLGGGSAPSPIINVPAAGGSLFVFDFPVGWPAVATATAISYTVANSMGAGSTTQVALFGYNVPI